MASSARAHAPKLPLKQFLALLMSLVLLAGVAGVVAAGFAVPIAAAANTTTDQVQQAFDELPADLKPTELSQISRIYANDGKTLLATFYSENRIVKPLDQIAPIMQNAVIATEDKRFWEHGAIDPQGFLRAAVNNYMGNEVQGGSTLTQQYVKNMLLEQATQANDPIGEYNATELDAGRKAREAKLAISVENTMSKKEILQGYLNIAQFGVGTYGVEAAAEHFFSTSAKDLNYLQAATIAGITKNPSKYDPTKSLVDAQQRRDLVLGLMYQQGYITKAEYDTGRKTPLKDTLKVKDVKVGCSAAGGAAFFCDYVTKEILNDSAFGKTQAERRALLLRGGLNIVTTLDVNKQKAAERTAAQYVPAKDPSGLATAIVSVEPGTGRILAMAQNRTFDDRGNAAGTTAVNYSADQVHGASAGFSAGSTFKMFVLAEWLKEGHTLSERVNANAQTWTTSQFNSSCKTFGHDTWSPRNSDGSENGFISVLQATYDSVNRAYASIEQKLDLCSVAQTATEIGFRPSLKSEAGQVLITPAMVLGVQNTSPLAQTNAYATIAAGGIYCNPIAIMKITGPDGKDIAVPQAGCHRVLDESIANTITYALTQTVSKGSARALGPMSDGHPIAGKTGTAQSSFHTWFIGYTPNLATGVWVGDPRGNVPHLNVVVNGKRYSPLFGSSVAAPEWKAYMDQALQGVPVKQFGAPNQAMIGGGGGGPSDSSGQDNSASNQSNTKSNLNNSDQNRPDPGQGNPGNGNAGNGNGNAGNGNSGNGAGR